MTIDKSQRVGIGTTSPATKLEVNATTPTIRLEDENSGNKRLELSIDANAVAKFSANQSASVLAFETTSSERMRIDSSGQAIFKNSNYVSFNNNGYIRTDSTGYLRLQMGSNGTMFTDASNNEVARIDSSGNVGIGTSSPAYNIHGSGI